MADTDWKAELKVAEDLATKAYEKRSASEEVFRKEMKVVQEHVDKAIKLGGKDAKKHWKDFIKGLREAFDALRKDVESFVNDVAKQFKIWGKTINWVKIRYFVVGAVAAVIIANLLQKVTL